jgi:SAM-dependent methyltransferase
MESIPADRWTSGADYDQWMGRWSRLLAHEFLKWLRLPAGLQWIDVCCGSGIVTEAIVEGCAPEKIAAVDASSAQIEFARPHRAHPNVTFEVADAMALPFEDASFDAAVCGLGLNYFPDPSRGVAEMRRVTRAGGTIAAYVWDYADGAKFLREFWDAAAIVDKDGSSFDQARRFPACTPNGLRRHFESADLSDLAVHELNIVTHFSSFDLYWSPLLTGQGSAPNYLASRDQQTRTAIREHLRNALPTNSEGAIELPARAWTIRAHRP